MLASCFATGAASTTKDKNDIKKMWKIGEYTGMAFQIKDDIFDLEKSNIIGKPTGIDIKEKKMTLPLIYLLNNSSIFEKRKIINIVKRHNTNNAKVGWLKNEIANSGGIVYATEKMIEYKSRALKLLKELPENESRLALEKIIDFTIDRKK